MWKLLVIFSAKIVSQLIVHLLEEVLSLFFKVFSSSRWDFPLIRNYAAKPIKARMLIWELLCHLFSYISHFITQSISWFFALLLGYHLWFWNFVWLISNVFLARRWIFNNLFAHYKSFQISDTIHHFCVWIAFFRLIAGLIHLRRWKRRKHSSIVYWWSVRITLHIWILLSTVIVWITLHSRRIITLWMMWVAHVLRHHSLSLFSVLMLMIVWMHHHWPISKMLRWITHIIML